MADLFARMIYGEALPTWALFLELAIAGLIVIRAGSRLAKLADGIADRLNISGGWVGLLLLATVTSLPEVVTGGVAVGLGNVDLAFAGIFGSCAFNITLIVLINGVIGGGSVLGQTRVESAHPLTGSVGIALIGLALIAIVLVQRFLGNPQAAQVAETGCMVLICFAYLFGMRLVYRVEKRLVAAATMDAPGEKPIEGEGNFGRVGALALLLVVSAWWLTKCGDILSTHHIEMIGRPLGATFVGAAFLALATSLPEIATSIAAVRLGNLDMALGNLFGSNMFNIFVIPMLKVVSFGRGDALLMSGPSFDPMQSMFMGILAILLTAIALGGLRYRSERRMLWRFGADSLLIAGTYVAAMYVLIADV